jgi:ribosome-binding protein aMBF1 (putative translation factor)
MASSKKRTASSRRKVAGSVKKPARKGQAGRKRSEFLDHEKRSIGERVHAKRVERGLSVKQLAEGICFFNHIYLIEKGKYAPNTTTLTQLADRLGVSVDWLLYGANGRKNGKRNGGAS